MFDLVCNPICLGRVTIGKNIAPFLAPLFWIFICRFRLEFTVVLGKNVLHGRTCIFPLTGAAPHVEPPDLNNVASFALSIA